MGTRAARKKNSVSIDILGTRANRKRRRDPNAPKRALSAFMIYSKERRPEITSANPHIAFGDIARTIGEEWRSMNARENLSSLGS